MRSPVYSQPLAAVGTALWGTSGQMVLPLDYIQLAFGVAVGGILSEDATGITWSVLMTFDDMSPDSLAAISISQTTTVITVTDPLLQARGGVVAGDVVRITGTGPTTDGWYTVVSTPTTTTYTLTSLVSQSVGPILGNSQYWRLFAGPTAVTAATARISAPLSHSTTGPCTGLVVKVTARTTGSLTAVVVQGAGPG